MQTVFVIINLEFKQIVLRAVGCWSGKEMVPMARNLLEREAVNERLPGITNNVGIRHVYYCVVGLYQ